MPSNLHRFSLVSPHLAVVAALVLGALSSCGPQVDPDADGPAAATVGTHTDELMSCSSTPNGAGAVGDALKSNYTISAIVADGTGVLKVTGHDVTGWTGVGTPPSFNGLVSLGTGFGVTGTFGDPSKVAYINSFEVDATGKKITILGVQRVGSVSTAISGTLNLTGGTYTRGGINFTRANKISAGSGYLSLSGYNSGTSTFLSSNWFLYGTCTLSATAVGSSGTITLNGTATGATSVNFFIDGLYVGTDNTAPFSVTYNSALIANGTHNLTIEAIDEAGNDAFSAPFTFSTSNVTAGPTVTASVSGTTRFLTLSATATGSAAVTKVEFYVDNKFVGADTASPYAINFDSRSVLNGTHSLVAKATDALNVTNASPAVSFNTSSDFSGPVVTASATGTKDTITLSATATDASGVYKVEFYVDNVLIGADTTSPYAVGLNSRTVTNGTHTVTAKAFDIYSQSTVSSGFSFTTANDFTAPTVTLTVTGTRDTINFSAAATDNVAVVRVEFWVDGVLKNSDYAAPFSYAFASRVLTNANHTIVAKAFDYYNQSSSSSVVITTNNDFSGPVVSGSVTGTAGTITFNATATDPAGVTKVWFYVDGAYKGQDLTAPYSMTLDSKTLTNGTHKLKFYATDTYAQATFSSEISFNVAN